MLVIGVTVMTGLGSSVSDEVRTGALECVNLLKRTAPLHLQALTGCHSTPPQA